MHAERTAPRAPTLTRCMAITVAGDRCETVATWARNGRRGVESYCTRHANLIISERGRRARPKTWVKL